MVFVLLPRERLKRSLRVVSRAEAAVILLGCEVGWVVEDIEDANVGELVVQRMAAEVCQRLCKEVLGSAWLFGGVASASAGMGC